MSSQFYVKLKYPVETTFYSQVTGNFLTCPGRGSNPDSGERQLEVSGIALDHIAIRAGPQGKMISTKNHLKDPYSLKHQSSTLDLMHLLGV